MIKTIKTESGKLSVIEFSEFLFNVKRIFYIYDIPAEDMRGGHAHRNCKQYVLPLHGSFEIKYFSKKASGNAVLNKPWEGYSIEPGTWVDLLNFSSGSVALVLCSEEYQESDYIRNFEEFKCEYGIGV